MVNYIPLNILGNHIFIRLPVKSLLNCSCVCKLWLQTVSDSEFRRIHAQHQSKQNPNHEKFICGPLIKYSFSRYSYDFETYWNSELRDKVSACSGIFYTLDVESTRPKMNRLPGFPDHRMKNFKLVKNLGYSNGMVCMEAWSTFDNRWLYIFFGNPSTGYYKILPEPLVHGPLIVGFGYDSFTDDYKYVRIHNHTQHPHIYSLNSNSWTINVQSRSNKHEKELKDSGLRDCIWGGTFVDGSIYWYVDESIVRFDLKEEKFTELDMPLGYMRRDISLKVLQGSLCIINRHSFPPHISMDVDMWLLKSEEDPNKQNIEKYNLIKLLELRKYYVPHIYPLSFRKDGKVLCCVKHLSPPKSRYILIDPHTSNIQDFSISENNSGIFKEFIFQSYFPGYVDTFISPNDHRGAKERVVART